MWRRVVCSSSSALASSCRSSPPSLNLIRRSLISSATTPSTPPPFQRSPNLSSPTSASGLKKKKKVEDIMPIATGHEREELQADLEGRDILEINHPFSPFGTKEAPAVVKSYYDKRIVGCPGVEGEGEHDVVWFWLEKGKSHECAVCSQYFKLEVVGPGGPPDGHH